MNAESSVKCEACAGSCNGSPIPGVLWNGERCDMCERYQSDSSAAAKLASCVGDMAEALAKIASGAITDCGPNRLGTVNLDAQTMQAIARAALRKAGLLS
jgi:hypothetical protein